MTQVASKARECNSQDIANTLNALAKFGWTTMGHYDQVAVDQLVVEALGKADTFNAQNLANTLNALCKFGFKNTQVVSTLSSRITLNFVKSFKAQEIASTLNALSKYHGDRSLVMPQVITLAGEAIVQAVDFTSQGIANTLHALAKLGHYDKGLVDLFIEQATKQIQSFNALEIGMIMDALTKFNHYNQDFVRLLTAEAQAKEVFFLKKSLICVLNSLAHFALSFGHEIHLDDPVVNSLTQTLSVLQAREGPVHQTDIKAP